MPGCAIALAAIAVQLLPLPRPIIDVLSRRREAGGRTAHPRGARRASDLGRHLDAGQCAAADRVRGDRGVPDRAAHFRPRRRPPRGARRRHRSACCCRDRARAGCDGARADVLALDVRSTKGRVRSGRSSTAITSRTWVVLAIPICVGYLAAHVDGAPARTSRRTRRGSRGWRRSCRRPRRLAAHRCRGTAARRARREPVALGMFGLGVAVVAAARSAAPAWIHGTRRMVAFGSGSLVAVCVDARRADPGRVRGAAVGVRRLGGISVGDLAGDDADHPRFLVDGHRRGHV